MNRYLFLGQLQTALEAQLVSEEVQRVMDYYENYIGEALDYGKSESEVLQELGDPKQLAQNIIESLKNEKDVAMKAEENSHSFSELFDDLMESTSQTISDAMKVVDKTVGNISDYINDKMNHEAFFEEGEQLTKELESVGTVDREMEVDIHEYPEVMVHLTNLPIVTMFQEAQNMKIEVHQDEGSDSLIEVCRSEKRLLIREKKARVYRLFGNTRRYIVLYLPLDYKGKLNYKCGNSSVRFKGNMQKYPGPIEIKCQNGDVQMKNLILGSLRARCDNGRIYLKQVLAYQADLKCDNGMIRYDMIANDYAKVLDLKTDNGLIKINDRRWSTNRTQHVIPARNQSKYELSVHAKCDNGMIRLTGF